MWFNGQMPPELRMLIQVSSWLAVASVMIHLILATAADVRLDWLRFTAG